VGCFSQHDFIPSLLSKYVGCRGIRLGIIHDLVIAVKPSDFSRTHVDFEELYPEQSIDGILLSRMNDLCYDCLEVATRKGCE
jgi:hypothetical protein